MWLAALGGRFAYVVHRACGHAVTWKTRPADLPLCSGDVVCHDCGQVLWCRAYDPWRARPSGIDSVPADHWGPTPGRRPLLFEGFQQVLRLATQCPPGPAGDDIRRAACELIEADSDVARETRRHRILVAIAHVEWRRSNGRSRDDDPAPTTLRTLADVLGAGQKERR